ncbi:MarR family winged helix-turn-helix transcriptional regulator [Marinicrinis lubricantis]|uniref:MarR family winged helix-turn-helix transcriptional regulator n=1 Tax=Marinicrinis lubricantis TaxID=2086470 RepID=A0ABW1IRZ4_9BACL
MDKTMLRDLIERYQDTTMTINRMMGRALQDCIPDGLTSDQCSILRYLKQKKQCTSSQLADFFIVSKSSITAMVTRLVSKGLIQRIGNEHDRRVTHLSLTEEGDAMYGTIQVRIEEVLSHYLNHFEENEAKTFIETYEKLANILALEEGSRGNDENRIEG